MINFVEVRFPEDISYGSLGGLCYSTNIIETNSFNEYRNINWPEGRLKYNISYGIRTEDQLGQLVNFFRARKGRATGFRFKDWTDYKVKNQIIGISNSSNSYQLLKTYHNSGQIDLREISKPVKGTVKVYSDDSILNFDLDYTTGSVRVLDNIPDGIKIYADYEFDVPVRFDSDELTYSLDSFNLNSCSSIFLIEIKNS